MRSGLYGITILQFSTLLNSLTACGLSNGILVPRGCDPFGQRHGSRPLAGSNFQSVIHGLPIFLRSLVSLSIVDQAINFGQEIQNFSDITLKEKQYEVLKLLEVEEKDVLAVLPTGYGKSLIDYLLPPV